ncbi:porin [Hydrogenophaga sp. BPS33]|uniref:porin n=1 Tax=Hydrogenophaga sp. BPS33 TaxID=2651974 RepID=UPI001320386C|nr:porin [Hydrogenophaga sp. BPS33]QHE84478.1 porin [Hydrogenophaga sp. BPS33]
MGSKLGIAVVGALACAVSGHAVAQVTLYGQVDAFLEQANTGNGQHLTRVSSGGASVSRWGMRGSEDLGGGLKANFRLESGFNLDDGTLQNSLAFSRWVHVGLSGPWGAVDAGRMWSPTFVVGLRSDVLARNRTSLITNMFRGASTRTGTSGSVPGFMSNSLRYTTPNFNGFSGEAMLSLGEAANNSSSGDGAGFNLQYSSGPLYLGYGYQALKSGSAAAPVANPTTEKTHMLGASYKWSSVTLYGTVNSNRSNAVGYLRSTNLQASVAWKVQGPHTVLAQVARRKVSDSPVAATGWQVGYDMDFSKRTKLYARYGRVDNKGGSVITLNGAALTGPNADPSFVGVGISHAF